MTKDELKQAVALAGSEGTLPLDLEVFDGFGRHDFKPVHVTVRQVAGLIRWQCQRFDREMDAEALDEIAREGRRKFVIVDGGEPPADVVAELVAALEGLFEHCAMIHSRWGDGCNQKDADAAINAARAAIAKARG